MGLSPRWDGGGVGGHWQQQPGRPPHRGSGAALGQRERRHHRPAGLGPLQARHLPQADSLQTARHDKAETRLPGDHQVSTTYSDNGMYPPLRCLGTLQAR